MGEGLEQPSSYGKESKMDIKAVSGDITQADAGAIVVNLFEGVQTPGGATGAADRAMDGAISKLIADGEIKGKKGEITVIHTLGKIPPARVVVAGLGKADRFNAEVVRQVMGSVCRRLRGVGIERAATILHGAGIGGMDVDESAQAISEGSLLGLYTFKRHLTRQEDDEKGLKELTVVESDASKLSTLQQSLDRGRVYAEATILARDMVNEPSNFMTPTHIAEVATSVAGEHGLELTVLDRPKMEELGMGGLLGVARGSAEPPKFIVLQYKGDPDNPDNNLGILGKGITFDTGGISLKSAAGMGEMKGDMSGAAAVISAIKAIAQLAPKLNVTAIAAATENMPGGSAQKPGDVLRTMSGKTVEVENTDAEGRLVLSDALCYARQMGLNRLVDVATLTGAIVTALGDVCSGGFTNNQDLLSAVVQAGETSGERIWELPMFEEYKEQNKSQVADVKNTGGRKAGSIAAAPVPGGVQRGYPLGAPGHRRDFHVREGVRIPGQGGDRSADPDAYQPGRVPGTEVARLAVVCKDAKRERKIEMKLKALIIVMLTLIFLLTALLVLAGRGDLELPWLGDTPEYTSDEVIAIVRNKMIEQCGAESVSSFSSDRFSARYEGMGAWFVWHVTYPKGSLIPNEFREWRFYEKSKIVDPLDRSDVFSTIASSHCPN